jgi:hypothetical protein
MRLIRPLGGYGLLSCFLQKRQDVSTFSGSQLRNRTPVDGLDGLQTGYVELGAFEDSGKPSALWPSPF